MTSTTTSLAMSEANAPAAANRPSETIPATVVLTALSVITAVGFGRVFSGWDFLGSMLFVVVGVHAVCLVLRLLNLPGYIALPLTMLFLFGLIAWKYYPDTLNGPFPSSRTWDFMWSDLQLARDQFPNAVAPVAPIGGFVIAATAASGLAALLSDAFAFRAYGRAEAAVPTAVLFVFAAALGIDNHRVLLTATWLGCALAAIAILRASHAQSEHAWIGQRARVLLSVLPLAGILAGCAAISGAVLGPNLPGAGEKGLVKTSSRNDVTEVLSPLVDIRSRLVTLTNVELFTVDAAEQRYWRVTGLLKFDGTTWGLADRDLVSVSGTFEQTPLGSTQLRQEFNIKGLKGNLLPAAYSPIAISRSDIYWVEDSGTLVLPDDDGISRNDTYEIVSAKPNLNPDVLRAATSLNPPGPEATALPDDFPDSVRDTAKQITDGYTTTYDKAFALQEWFRSEFTYDLTVQKGHGNNAIRNFLQNRRGYCEQFSGAFAAMMRSLGIPARVAVGFTSGELRSDGLYHVFGRNAHAWPEVWFDGIGWVSFEPTPGRGEPGAQEYTGVQPEQAAAEDPNGATPVTVPQGAPPTTAASGTNAVSTTLPRDPSTPTTRPAGVLADTTPDGGFSATTWLITLMVLAALAWVALLPRVLARLAVRRRSADPVERIEAAWRRSAQALSLIGLEPKLGETPLEHARRAERLSGIDHRTLRELAVCATAAIFGGVGDTGAAVRCDQLAHEVVAAVKLRMNPVEKAVTRLDPRRAKLLT
jgi:transglutaminase-like putative cysteine protease